MRLALHAELIPETEAEAGALLMLDQQAAFMQVRRDLRVAAAQLVRAIGLTPRTQVEVEYRLRAQLDPELALFPPP